MAERLGYVALAASILFSVAGQLMMKWAVQTPEPWSDWTGLLRLGAALGVYSLGVVNWILALRTIKLAVAYSVGSLNYVGILGGSYWLFGEQINGARILGVLLILSGVLLVVLRDRPAVPLADETGHLNSAPRGAP